MNPSQEKLDRWIRCVGRELGLRTSLYPKWVKEGKMKSEDAFNEKRSMEEIYEYLKLQREKMTQAGETVSR